MNKPIRSGLTAALGVVVLLLIALAVRHFTQSPPLYHETRFLMDTFVNVTIAGLAPEQASRAADEAFERMEEVDRQMARVEGSPLWALNEAGGGQADAMTAKVIRVALEWAARSRGAFDPTLATLIDLWDIPAGPKPPPSDEEVADALTRTGWQRARWLGSMHSVRLEGVALDLGAIAKGYAVDLAAEALHRSNASGFIIDGGGDLMVWGDKYGKPWRVGIQDPDRPGLRFRVVELPFGALVTSGDYERAYDWEGQRIHHILDPKTGRPATGCRSVTVWAQRVMDADAVATAVFVMGPEAGLAWLEELADVEGLIIDAEGDIHVSSGFEVVAPTNKSSGSDSAVNGPPSLSEKTAQPEESGKPARKDSVQ